MTTNLNYEVRGNILVFDEMGAEATFPWPIKQVLSFPSVFVVRVEPDPGTCFNENVFGVNHRGDVIWRIAIRSHVYADSPYTSIVGRGKEVALFNWDGEELLVSPQTGEILSARQGK